MAVKDMGIFTEAATSDGKFTQSKSMQSLTIADVRLTILRNIWQKA